MAIIVTRKMNAVMSSLIGYTISTNMLNSIFNRFAKKHKFLNFDDFVYCMASLKLAVSKLHHVTLCAIVVWICFRKLSKHEGSRWDGYALWKGNSNSLLTCSMIVIFILVFAHCSEHLNGLSNYWCGLSLWFCNF